MNTKIPPSRNWDEGMTKLPWYHPNCRENSLPLVFSLTPKIRAVHRCRLQDGVPVVPGGTFQPVSSSLSAASCQDLSFPCLFTLKIISFPPALVKSPARVSGVFSLLSPSQPMQQLQQGKSWFIAWSCLQHPQFSGRKFFLFLRFRKGRRKA